MPGAVAARKCGLRASFTARAEVKAWAMRWRWLNLRGRGRFELFGNLKLYALDPVINGYAPFHCTSLTQSVKFEFYHRKGRNAR